MPKKLVKPVVKELKKRFGADIYSETAFEMMKKKVDFKTFKGFPSETLVYDKEEKTAFRYSLSSKDFLDNRAISYSIQSASYPLVSYQPLQAPDLVEAYQAGKLQGRLKEIAAGLDEEDNAVVMLIKYKL